MKFQMRIRETFRKVRKKFRFYVFYTKKSNFLAADTRQDIRLPNNEMKFSTSFIIFS